MPMNAEMTRIDGERIVESLQEAIARIGGAEGELPLDFSGVSRIAPSALGALEKLANAAAAKGVKVALCGVNLGVYKALKLVKLAPRFTFPA